MSFILESGISNCKSRGKKTDEINLKKVNEANIMAININMMCDYRHCKHNIK